ncbi:MAG: acetyl-CoA carboxylase biotin carboxylase subunit, partial [Desulfomicrobiaceae bacterium]|nr:acetyl-CoA carboxylase biotin carboxylase subunit [Desulfomicrobiaceae bacterium]
QPQPWLSVHTQVPQDRPYEIPTDFDPNLALAIVWGKDLAEAKARGLEFLEHLELLGENAAGESLRSNIAFLKRHTTDLLAF